MMIRLTVSRKLIGAACVLSVVAGSVSLFPQAAYADSWAELLKPLVKEVIVPGASMGMKKIMERKKTGDTSSSSTSSTNSAVSSFLDSITSSTSSSSSSSSSSTSWGDDGLSSPQEPFSGSGSTTASASSGSSSLSQPAAPPPPVATP